MPQKQQKKPPLGEPNYREHAAWFHANNMDINTDNSLGSGTFGSVYRIRTPDGTAFALKKLKLQEQKNGHQELRTNQRFHIHKNVVRCVAGKKTTKGYELLSELAPHGDLFTVLQKHKFARRQTANVLYNQLMSALHYMHEAMFCHRDLKPANILVFGRRLFKIGDFGQCVEMDGDLMVRRAGTPRYQPPETSRTVDGVKLDQWAAAMIFLFALLGKDPWLEASMDDPEYAAFQDGDLKALIKIDPAWIRATEDFRFLRRLLAHNPKKRIVPRCYSHAPSDLRGL